MRHERIRHRPVLLLVEMFLVLIVAAEAFRPWHGARISRGGSRGARPYEDELYEGEYNSDDNDSDEDDDIVSPFLDDFASEVHSVVDSYRSEVASVFESIRQDIMETTEDYESNSEQHVRHDDDEDQSFYSEDGTPDGQEVVYHEPAFDDASYRESMEAPNEEELVYNHEQANIDDASYYESEESISFCNHDDIPEEPEVLYHEPAFDDATKRESVEAPLEQEVVYHKQEEVEYVRYEEASALKQDDLKGSVDGASWNHDQKDESKKKLVESDVMEDEAVESYNDQGEELEDDQADEDIHSDSMSIGGDFASEEESEIDQMGDESIMREGEREEVDDDDLVDDSESVNEAEVCTVNHEEETNVAVLEESEKELEEKGEDEREEEEPSGVYDDDEEEEEDGDEESETDRGPYLTVKTETELGPLANTVVTAVSFAIGYLLAQLIVKIVKGLLFGKKLTSSIL